MQETFSSFVLPRQNRRERIAQNSYNKGSWSREERLLLLKGLRRHGVGRWKEIGTVVTTRDATQIKGYSQRLVQKMRQGVNIFQELEEAERKGSDPPTPPNKFAMVAAKSLRMSSPQTVTLMFPDTAMANGHDFQSNCSTDEIRLAAGILCRLKSNARYHSPRNQPPPAT